MRKFRNRKSIKLTLATAVVAAFAVPVAHADPQPLQQYEKESGIALAPSGAVVDGHHQALLTRQHGQSAGVIADGLRYQALAQHYAQSPTPAPISDNSPAFGNGGTQVVAEPSGGESFDWSDAAAGFGAAIGLMLLAGLGVVLLGSRNRTAHA
jgi:hypothetical protein